MRTPTLFSKIIKVCLTGMFFVMVPFIAVQTFAASDVPVVDATNEESGINAAELQSLPSAGTASTVDLASANNDAPTSNNVEQRVAQIEKRLPAHSQMEMLAKIDQLQGQIQELRGQIEVQAHDIKLLQDQQRAQLQDFEQRFAKLSQASANINAASNVAAPANASTASTKQTSSATSNTTQTSVTNSVAITQNTSDKDKLTSSTATNNFDLIKAQKSYQEAYNLLKARKYDEAKAAFQAFVKEFPSGGYAINSHYWLGEIYLLQNNLDKAGSEFNSVLSNNPTHIKTAEALLKLGYVYSEKKQYNKARTALNKVVKQYPGTSAAQLATAKLQDIKT